MRRVELDLRDPVGARGHEPRDHRDERTADRIGTDVRDPSHPEPDDRAVAPRPDLDVVGLTAAVRHVHEVLVPRLAPRDRSTRVVAPAPRPATARRTRHPWRRSRRPRPARGPRPGSHRARARRRSRVVRRRPTACSPTPTIRVTLGDDDATVRLHRRGRDPMVDEPGADDDLGGRPTPRRARRAGGPSSRWRRTREQQRRIRFERDERVGHGGERFQLDLDELGRVERLRAASRRPPPRSAHRRTARARARATADRAPRRRPSRARAGGRGRRR